MVETFKYVDSVVSLFRFLSVNCLCCDISNEICEGSYKWQVEKYVARSGRGLLCDIIPASIRKTEKYNEEPHSGQPAFRMKFKTDAS
jgi:hypothetical protein